MSPRVLASACLATFLIAVVPTVARAQLVAIDGGLVFCTSDSDCGNPYLACAPTHVYVCRDADASANSPALADAGLCPATSPEVLDLCVVRYQLPCDASASCGPAGFTCAANGTLCNAAGCTRELRCLSEYTLCTSDSDCPTGWSCYSPPGLPAPADSGVAGPPKACYPPFAMFNGPAGGPGPGGIGGPGVVTDAGPSSGAASDASSPASGGVGGGCGVGKTPAQRGRPWLVAAALAVIARRRRSRRRPEALRPEPRGRALHLRHDLENGGGKGHRRWP